MVAPYGSRIGVRASSSQLLEGARRQILPGWNFVEPGEVEHLWSLTSDAAYYDSQRLPGSPLEQFRCYFHLYIGATAVDSTFLHAGAVVANGLGILLPGSSYAGKSTLTQALHQAGAHVYSDDLAVLDLQGRLRPYPKPMSFRSADGDYEMPVPDWRPDLPEVPVALVAGLRYREGAGDLEVESLSPARGCLLLLENSLSTRQESARDLSVLAKVCSEAHLCKGFRGEATEAALALLKLLSQAGKA